MAKLNNSDSTKIRSLIKKVKALAEHGELGEKESAKVKLNQLLDKYQIKIFEEAKKKKRSFKLADFGDCKTIMVHCIFDTDSIAKIEGSKQKKELYCKLTDEEYIDVCEKFNHYYPDFYRQREAFIKAFILKNDLGIVDGDGDDDIEQEMVSNINNLMNSVQANRLLKHKELFTSNTASQ